MKVLWAVHRMHKFTKFTYILQVQNVINVEVEKVRLARTLPFQSAHLKPQRLTKIGLHKSFVN